MRSKQQVRVRNSWLRRAGLALLVPLPLALAFAACGGDSSDDTGGAGSGPAANGGSSANGSACVTASCPDVNALNTVLPGCCQLNGDCGGLLALMGTSFCAPPNIGDVVGDLSDRFEALPTESVEADPACPDQAFFGTELAGCCDASGVCGLSTAGLNGGTAALFLGGNVPLSCVAPEEAAALGAGLGAGQVFAGEAQACTP